MRLAALEPYLVDLLAYLGGASRLVGGPYSVSKVIDESAPGGPVERQIEAVTMERPDPHISAPDLELLERCGCGLVSVQGLRQAKPQRIIAESPSMHDSKLTVKAAEILSHYTGTVVELTLVTPTTLDSLDEIYLQLGTLVANSAAARALTQRVRAQIMDWADNFYPRMKNKKVVVLSSVAPLRVAGRWVPDLIRLASGVPMHFAAGEPPREISFSELESFRPDVLLVAPEGYKLEESVKTLKFLERHPTWDALPAVKRGEVIFSDGLGLYAPGPKLIHGAAVLISAMAGLESGYITARDEFFRLRWVELHRHRFV